MRSGTVKRVSVFLFAALVYFLVNHQLVDYLVRHFKDFMLKNVPLTIDKLQTDLTGQIVPTNPDDNRGIFACLTEGKTPAESQLHLMKIRTGENSIDLVGSISFPNEYILVRDIGKPKPGEQIFRLLETKSKTPFVLEKLFERDVRKIKLDGISKPITNNGFSYERSVSADLDEDGKKELVVSFGGGYERMPRGVACFELENGNRIWEHYCSYVTYMEIVDLEGDGKKEIVVSTFAVNNGVVVRGPNETSDAYSYVMVLDHRGNLRWQNETGGWYSTAYSIFADLDNDGKKEIITSIKCHRATEKKRGKIFIFNSDTGEILKQFQPPGEGASFSKVVAHKINGQYRIYAGDGAGTVWLFDEQLNVLDKITGNGPVCLSKISTGPGDWNYLFVKTENDLTAYDWNLQKRRFRFTFEKKLYWTTASLSILLIPIRGEDNSVGQALVNIAGQPLYRLTRSRFTSGKMIRFLGVPGNLLALLGLILFNGYMFYIRRRKKQLKIEETKQKEKQRKIRYSMQFPEVAQRIAQQLKNPISTILWTAEKIKRSIDCTTVNEDEPDYSQLADFLVEDVGKLVRRTGRLMTLIRMRHPRFKETALKPLMEKIIRQYRDPENRLGGSGEIRFWMKEDITLNIDEELIKTAVMNLLENALEAVTGWEDGKDKSSNAKIDVTVTAVKTFLMSRKKEVRLEVSDTGPGIDDADCENIYKPFFTGKTGDENHIGIGLTLSRWIIEAHGGYINVYSRKEIGTKFAITFPVDV